MRLIDGLFFRFVVRPFLDKNKAKFCSHFPCYCIKQLDSMLQCICSVIDHRRRQNVVRTSVTHLATPLVPLFCSYYVHFDVFCDLLLNRRTATWNLVVKYKHAEIFKEHVRSAEVHEPKASASRTSRVLLKIPKCFMKTQQCTRNKFLFIK